MMATRTAEKKTQLLSEQDILRKIYRLKNGEETGRKLTYMQIADYLNREKIPSPRGGEWAFSSVRFQYLKAEAKFGAAEGSVYARGEMGPLNAKQVQEILYDSMDDAAKIRMLKLLLERK